MMARFSHKTALLQNPAALWKRVVAYLIDALIVNFIVVFPFRERIRLDSVSSFSETYNYLSSAPGLSYKLFLVFLAIGTLTILYWAVFEYRLKQSVGKMAMNLSVRHVTGNMSFRSAVVRNLSKVSTLILALDVAYMIYKKSNRRYLEIISNTEVVEGVSQ